MLEAAPTETTERDAGDGVRIVENAEENRLQIIFPGKPPAETRTRLKRAWVPMVAHRRRLAAPP